MYFSLDSDLSGEAAMTRKQNKVNEIQKHQKFGDFGNYPDNSMISNRRSLTASIASLLSSEHYLETDPLNERVSKKLNE